MFSLKYTIAVFVILLAAGTLMAQDLKEMTPERFAALSADRRQDWLKKIRENYVAREDFKALKEDYELLASS